MGPKSLWIRIGIKKHFLFYLGFMRSYKIPGTALYIDNTLQIQCMARSPHSRRIDTTLCWSQHGHFSIDKKYFQNAQSPFFILLTPRSETRWVEYCFKDKLHHENMHMCVLLYKSWQVKTCDMSSS